MSTGSLNNSSKACANTMDRESVKYYYRAAAATTGEGLLNRVRFKFQSKYMCLQKNKILLISIFAVTFLRLEKSKSKIISKIRRQNKMTGIVSNRGKITCIAKTFIAAEIRCPKTF